MIRSGRTVITRPNRGPRPKISADFFADRGQRAPRGKFVLISISDQTHGHGAGTLAAVWQQYLRALLEESEK